MLTWTRTWLSTRCVARVSDAMRRQLVPSLRPHGCANVRAQWLGRDDCCAFYVGGVEPIFVDMAHTYAGYDMRMSINIVP